MAAGPSDEPTARDEDALWVARAARGDTGALALLYDRHAPALLALAARILGSRSEAEDLLHDVFLEAWDRAYAYDPARGSVRAWLALRTRSRAIDRKKSAGVSRTQPITPLLAHEAALTARDAALTPDHALVRRVLAELPEDQRTVLLLGYFDGLSSSEIAERMRVPIGTVKSRVAAALGKLRSALGARRSA
jgi:RNA polymerase sigma-70 factor (ECF subfamily)